MSIFSVGRICVKLAGRDAGRKCVIIDDVEGSFVLVDGETRRKKVNLKHLEPLDQVIEIRAGANPEEVRTAFKELGIEIKATKPKQVAAKPVKHKAKKEQTKEEKKAESKKAAKAPKVEAVSEAPKAEEPVSVAEAKPKRAKKKEE